MQSAVSSVVPYLWDHIAEMRPNMSSYTSQDSNVLTNESQNAECYIPHTVELHSFGETGLNSIYLESWL